MNIFIVDSDPVEAAKQLCDRHVVKMILESAQLLSTAVRILTEDTFPSCYTLYRKAHINHPSSKWVRESEANFRWLVDHALALCVIYARTAGKRHASEQIILNCRELVENKCVSFARTDLTPVKLAMPLPIKSFYGSYDKEDGNYVADLHRAVTAYRAYYMSKEFADGKPMTWTYNPYKPDWYFKDDASYFP